MIPIAKVGPVSVAELWHGPTGAFKDLALTVVTRLVNHFLKKDGEKATLLVATTGDTGSAAIHSVLGRENVKIICLFPRGRISHTQQLQMTTVDAPNVTVGSCDGICEDIDAVIVKLFNDRGFAKAHNLTWVNSINVGRIILQVTHYIYIYLRLIPKANKSLVFSIPCGGLGHLASGILAMRMGLPIQFLANVNENDSVHRVFSTGVLSVSSVVSTYANAMDCEIAYNIERVLYFMSGEDAAIVKAMFEEFERDRHCALPPDLLSKNDCVSTARVTQEELMSTMKQVWADHHYLLCPHTAIAMHASLKLLKEKAGSTDIVVLATATAAKFPEVVEKAGLSLPSPLPPSVARLEGKAETKMLRMEKGEDWEAILRNIIDSVCGV